MKPLLLFLTAGLLEIGGGYFVWLWLREQRSFLIAIVGFVALAAYGVIPTFQPSEHPFGRIYAAYGAIFIVLAMLWGWGIDGRTPDLRDWLGAIISILGATVMLLPRASAASLN